jgi:hypothetical protein
MVLDLRPGQKVRIVEGHDHGKDGEVLRLFTLYSMHCILCIVFYALYSMHCILCIVFYAL